MMEVLLVLIVLAPGMLLIAELVLSLIGNTSSQTNDIADENKDNRKLAIIMPAHNEDSVVINSVQSIYAQLAVGDILVVVADNCTDATAEVVRSLNLDNVVVLERTDLVNRGKGFALDYGHQHLKQKDEYYDLIGIIDADCQFANDDAVKKIKHKSRYADLFQVSYLMKSNANTSLLSSFAWYIKTASRSIGMSKLFGACHIQGSGFFISANVSGSVNFASGSIVEDLELGLNMAENRVFCQYLPSVALISEMPSDVDVLRTQKSRWEVGHLKVLFEESFPRALRSIRSYNLRYFLLVCDLSIPPLVTYFGFLFLIFFVLSILGNAGSIFIFIYLLSISYLIYFHWKRFCLYFHVDFSFIQLVAYIKIKIKVIKNYSSKKSRVWNKTKR
ncbi:TPA: glycosyltransferase [Vibrio vulnificus]|nr:glycosyltransferase [Vibrio vulnificus]